MIDVVIRLTNVVDTTGAMLVDDEAREELTGRLAVTAVAELEDAGYRCVAAIAVAEPVPLDQRADRLDPTAGELAHVDRLVDDARRRAWHEDDTL